MSENLCVRYAENIVQAVAQPLLVLDGMLHVRGVNPAYLRRFRVSAEAVIGRPLAALGFGQGGGLELRRKIEAILASETTVIEEFRVACELEGIGACTVLVDARRIRRAGVPDLILLAIDPETDREALIFELEAQKEFNEKLVDSVREALLVLNNDLRVRTANACFYERFRVAPEETEGRPIFGLGNGQWDIPELRELLEEVLPLQTSVDGFEITHDFERIGERTMLLNARRLSHYEQIIVAIRDVTDERRHEVRQAAFMGEMQHRVKNILNNVRALAIHTRRGRHEIADFLGAFESRLDALARAQDLLMRSPSEAVMLGEIIQAELGSVGAEPGRDYLAQGAAVRLTPRDAQAMAMGVHELTTNAAKYGALAAGGGRIEIDWRIEARENGEHVVFLWRERGVRMATRPNAKGFGSRVIERSLPQLLGGSAELTFVEDGVACRIEFPLAA